MWYLTILLLPTTLSSLLLSPTTAYDVSSLQRLCYASSLSYLPLGSIHTSPYHATSRFSPLAQVQDPLTESGATIFQDDDDTSRMIVACRGSATLSNFATNLRFKLVSAEKPFDDSGGGRGKVHGGFQEAAFGLWGCLVPELQKLQEERQEQQQQQKKLCFTGHSLGGATALLCAGHAAASGMNDVAEVVTFGGPRVGDATFARHIDETLLVGATVRHVVHDADPVLANNKVLWDTMGFESTGEEIVCDPHSPTIYRSRDEQPSSGGVAWNILDHCNYLGTFVGPRIRVV